MVQIAGATDERGHPLPVVHTIELVDWATGGPKPNIDRSALKASWIARDHEGRDYRK
jgi:glycolate oxidase iron-sulfur subunit